MSHACIQTFLLNILHQTWPLDYRHDHAVLVNSNQFNSLYCKLSILLLFIIVHIL